MTPKQFKAAREELQLTVAQAAVMLGVSQLQVRRMEMASDRGSARQVNGTMQRLVKAYLDGYRPDDWPRRT